MPGREQVKLRPLLYSTTLTNHRVNREVELNTVSRPAEENARLILEFW
jgi:hypothetical protein